MLARILLTLATSAAADIINYEFAAWEARGSDDDLLRFITRPDLTPPRLDVTFHKKAKVAPGYLFVAPYDCLECSFVPITHYVTQQIGPHIYTQDGELVWSGIDIFPDKTCFDFRPVIIDGAYHLACITPRDAVWHPFPDGAAMLLDSSYQLVDYVTSTDLGYRIDLHEFNVIDDGRTALLTVKEARESLLSDDGTWTGMIMENFVIELDLETQEQRFLWKASDHVSLLESTNPPPDPEDGQKNWDWFHLNSIDKDGDGNYLLSARATNTIYLVSPTGSILWRLGGLQSSFQQNFNFSRQHHARIREQGETSMIISLFDNAADDSGDYEPTSSESSVKIVALDFITMTATLRHHHPRPGGGHSEARGNIEYLPNGGMLCSWGENAYITEYARPGGGLVYQAAFASRRFANYRAYKMDFIAHPISKPVAKAFASANARGELGTTIYVSWNGATEVATWRYYSHASKRGVESVVQIGSTEKTGFETGFVATGFHPIVWVEAVDVYGSSLANSSLEAAELPLGFHSPDNPLLAAQESATADSHRAAHTALAFVAGVAFTIAWYQVQIGRRRFSRRTGPTKWPRKGQ